MNSRILKELNKQFAVLKSERLSKTHSEPPKRTKSVTTLALEAFIQENQDKAILESTKLHKDFAC